MKKPKMSDKHPGGVISKNGSVYLRLDVIQWYMSEHLKQSIEAFKKVRKETIQKHLNQDDYVDVRAENEITDFTATNIKVVCEDQIQGIGEIAEREREYTRDEQ